MNITEFEKLKLEGEEVFKTICSEVNDISQEHIRKDKDTYRRKGDLEEIFVALALYKRI